MSETNDIRVHTIKRYGWMPDLPDARDHIYAAPATALTKLPAKVDLRPDVRRSTTRDNWAAAPATPSPQPCSSTG